MPSSKKTWAGMMMRREVLIRVGIDLDHVTGGAGYRAATDDMLDAAVATWTAKRILEGDARTIPAIEQVGSRGRNNTIWI